MKFQVKLGVAACVWLVSTSLAVAVSPNASEMNEARRFVAAKFEGVQEAKPPEAGRRTFDVSPFFSFTYGGKPSAEFLKTWKCERASKKLDDQRTQRTIVYFDPTTKLEVRCEAIDYADFPAVEWVVYFENKGHHDTPILANVQAIDTSLTGDPQTKEITVHHARGTKVVIEDFGPIDDVLAAGASLKIGSLEKGMSSVEALPFFNVDFGGARGMIAAVGWSGSWSAVISRDAATSVRVQAGMDSTHLLLHPGERIRTPRMLVMFWQADRLRGHNLWRRLILTHYSPRPGGKPVVAPLCDASWGAVKAEDHIAKINWWGDHKLPMDCFWIDAGWNGKTGEDVFRAAANRVPNAEFYPHGMKEVSDAAHKRGLKFLLWTWPHRALPGLEVAAEHPEWLVNNEALDHGNPVVNQWMIDKYSRSVDEYGLDVFRQDGHVIIPADSGPDRQGINQIRYFEGFYAFWDALLEQHPNLLIDNCAGGGTKIDIETARRSIPLWRSDYANTNANNYDPAGIQAMTYGLSFYVPISGGCSVRTTPYDFRSGYGASLCLMWHFFVTGTWDPIGKIDDKDFDFEKMRKLMDEYVAIRAYFYEDFYPLSPYSVAADAWMAWQFDRPEKGDGLVQAFRREKCGNASERLRLHALDPAATYEIKDWDAEKPQQFSGKDLLEDGLPVTTADQPGAVVITYKKKP